MADRHGEGGVASARRPGHADLEDPSTTLLRRVQAHLPTSTQVVGLLTLLIAGAALQVLAGLTLRGAVLVALVFLGPLAGAADQPHLGAVRVLVVAAAALYFATLAAATWAYRHLTGRHAVGADRVDRAARSFTPRLTCRGMNRELEGELEAEGRSTGRPAAAGRPIMETGGDDILVLLQSALVVPFEAATDRLTPWLSPPRPRLTASAPISSSRPFAERHHEQCASQFPSPPRHEQQRKEESVGR